MKRTLLVISILLKFTSLQSQDKNELIKGLWTIWTDTTNVPDSIGFLGYDGQFYHSAFNISEGLMFQTLFDSVPYEINNDTLRYYDDTNEKWYKSRVEFLGRDTLIYLDSGERIYLLRIK